MKSKGSNQRRPPASSSQSWVRLFLVGGLSVIFLAYMISKTYRGREESSLVNTKYDVLAAANHSDARISWDLKKCSNTDYAPRVAGCTPKNCRRVVYNNFTSLQETRRIRDFLNKAMSLGGGDGGPTIFDVHGGALSVDDKFIDLYTKLKQTRQNPFVLEEMDFIRSLLDRIRKQVEKEFEVSGLFLTSPTFFSKIAAGLQPKKINDEYWHAHVDTKAYGSFVYTTLLYLSDAGVDFEGGRFAFVSDEEGREDSYETVVEPAMGRLSIFTSGSENLHLVEKVTKGTRYAFTVAFTCNKSQGIADPMRKAYNLFDSSG